MKEKRRAATAAAPAETNELVDAWEPEVEYELPVEEAQWDGRHTRFRLAYPMIRDHVIVGKGEEIVVKASWNKRTQRWHGPEAEHVEDLFKLGVIAGSPQARERAAQISAIEHERGVNPTPENPLGRPELKEMTNAQFRRQWERVLGQGPEDVLRREKQEARSEEHAARDMANAADRLAAIVERVMPAVPVPQSGGSEE